MSRFLTLLLLIPFGLFGQIPETIVTDRSLVILNLPLEQSGEFLVRGDWKERASQLQQMLRTINVDAIGYLHIDDWQANQTVQLSYKLFFATRNVQNVVFLEQNGSLFHLSVRNAQSMAELWKTEAGSIRQAMIRLGNAIKQKNFESENFLPIESAEVFTDIPFSRNTALSNFPDRIRRFTLGVAKFEDEAQNRQLEEVLNAYPFKYELFEYIDDEDAFRKGYQYVLLNLTTSGKTIQELLNLSNPEINETAFISSTRGDSSSVNLKTIPADAKVTKFYIKQTVNKEISVGRNWDADITWQQALTNFIHNLNIAFKKI